METFAKDVRYSLRMFWEIPTFTLVSVNRRAPRVARPNFHSGDQPSFIFIYMFQRLFENNRAGQIEHDLVNFNHDSTVGITGVADGMHMRIDLLPWRVQYARTVSCP